MEPMTIFGLAMAALLALLFSGMPIGVCFATVGIVMAYSYGGWTTLFPVGGILYEVASDPVLVALPLFLLMAELFSVSEASSDIYDCTSKWFGRRNGGLAIASIIGCAIFAAVNSSSVSTAAIMGRIGGPEMLKRNYHPTIVAGCLAAGGTLGILIPPSIPFMIYATFTRQSIGQLFMAGVMPGILLATLLCLYILVVTAIRPDLAPPGPISPWKDKFMSLRKLGGLIIVIFMVLGGIYFGVVTASEAGAMGAVGALFVGAILRRLNLHKVRSAVAATLRTAAMAFLIIGGAKIMAFSLTIYMIPHMIAERIITTTSSPLVLLALISALFFVLGMFWDALSTMVITVPLFFPATLALGIHPIWLGVIMVINMEIANITPPVALNLYVVQGTTGIPFEQAAKGVAPFVGVMLMGLAIIVLFPDVSLWLPATMK